MDLRRAVVCAAVAAVMSGVASAARAGDAIGTEWWFGGGFHDPEYHDGGMVTGRGGAGLVFLEHVDLGANLQFDRDRWFWFGYAGVILPAISSVEPFGRFHIGQRDDSSETNTQWSAGLRYGIPSVLFYVEVFRLIEPNEDKGACVGLIF